MVTTPGKNAEAVADLTIAFLVILARGVVRAAGFLAGGGRVGESTFEGAEWFGHDLGGHLLGLVGYGQVGRRVALRALAMGMEVASFDPNVDADGDARPTACGPPGFGELLDEARFVSLHARQPASDRDLFGEPEFARMPGRLVLRQHRARDAGRRGGAVRGAVRRATSRGLRSTSCARVPPGEVNPLLGLPNVVATPHIGGATFETLDRGAAMVAEEIERFAAGGCAPERDQSPGAGRMSEPVTLAIDAGTGSCRAVDLRPRRTRSSASGQREWAHAALPGVPGAQVFDTEGGWRLICECVREALAAAGVGRDRIAGVSATSMREGMVLYDRAGNEIWACPNVDGRAGEEGAALVASGEAEIIYAEGGDWVSITSPARFRWIQRHQPDVLRRDRSHGHAVGLDRHAPVRRVHDRSVRGLELGAVLTRRSAPGRIACST